MEHKKANIKSEIKVLKKRIEATEKELTGKPKNKFLRGELIRDTEQMKYLELQLEELNEENHGAVKHDDDVAAAAGKHDAEKHKKHAATTAKTHEIQYQAYIKKIKDIKNEEEIRNLQYKIKDKTSFNDGIQNGHEIDTILIYAHPPDISEQTNTINYALLKNYKDTKQLIHRYPAAICKSQNKYNTLNIALLYNIERALQLLKYSPKTLNTNDDNNTFNIILNKKDIKIETIVTLFSRLLEDKDNKICNSQNKYNTFNIILNKKDINIETKVVLFSRLLEDKDNKICNSQDSNNTLNIALLDNIECALQLLDYSPKTLNTNDAFNTFNIIIDKKDISIENKVRLFSRLLTDQDNEICNSQDSNNTLLKICRTYYKDQLIPILAPYKKLVIYKTDNFNTFNILLHYNVDETNINLLLEDLVPSESPNQFNTLNIAIEKIYSINLIRKLLYVKNVFPNNSQDIFNTLNYILKYNRLDCLFSDIFDIKQLMPCNSKLEYGANTINIAIDTDHKSDIIVYLIDKYKAKLSNCNDENYNTVIKLIVKYRLNKYLSTIKYCIYNDISLILPYNLLEKLLRTSTDILKVILASDQYQPTAFANHFKELIVKAKNSEYRFLFYEEDNIVLLEKYYRLITASKDTDVSEELIRFAEELDTICKNNNDEYMHKNSHGQSVDMVSMSEKPHGEFMNILDTIIKPQMSEEVVKIIYNYNKGFPTNNYWVNKLTSILEAKELEAKELKAKELKAKELEATVKDSASLGQKYIKYKMKYIKLRNSMQ
jgi:hypothetical protein